MPKKIENILFSALSNGSEKQIREVYELIYNNYYKLVYFCIAKYINDDDLIKDLANESFLSFFLNADKVEKSVKYYLLITAKNTALEYLSKNKNVVITDEVLLLNIEDQRIKSNQVYKDLIDDMLMVLSKQEVEIIIYHAVEQMPFKELETKYGIKAKTLNKTYERAIKKFRKSGRSTLYEK